MSRALIAERSIHVSFHFLKEVFTMRREPRKTEQAQQAVPPPNVKSTGRFQIEKLEERIAPSIFGRGYCHFGMRYKGRCP